jgi:hypothetical protein
VTVNGGFVRLPFLERDRDRFIQGASAPRLEQWRSRAPFAVDEATIEERTNPEFGQPRKQK